MDTQVKAETIGRIISVLRFNAKEQGKAFNEGDTFFALAFKTDKELKKIAELCGVA